MKEAPFKNEYPSYKIGINRSFSKDMGRELEMVLFSSLQNQHTEWKGSHQIQLPHLIWRKPLVQPKPRMVKKHPYSSIKAQHN